MARRQGMRGSQRVGQDLQPTKCTAAPPPALCVARRGAGSLVRALPTHRAGGVHAVLVADDLQGLLTHQRVVSDSGRLQRQRPRSPLSAGMGLRTRFNATGAPGAGPGSAVRPQCDPRRSQSPPRTWRRSGYRTGRPASKVKGRGGAIGSRGAGGGQFAAEPRGARQAGQLQPRGPSIA